MRTLVTVFSFDHNIKPRLVVNIFHIHHDAKISITLNKGDTVQSIGKLFAVAIGVQVDLHF